MFVVNNNSRSELLPSHDKPGLKCCTCPLRTASFGSTLHLCDQLFHLVRPTLVPNCFSEAVFQFVDCKLTTVNSVGTKPSLVRKVRALELFSIRCFFL